MPLKHRAETALILVLALAICVTGVLLSLLPLAPWMLGFLAIVLTLTVLYPLALSGLFFRNRADYEFRILHWFPFWMTILFAVLLYLAPKFVLAEILALGFFFLWSLPLVALGIAFLIMFALHVLRRSALRTTLLSLLLVLFAGGAIASEMMGKNPEIAQSIFQDPRKLIALLHAPQIPTPDTVSFVSSSSQATLAMAASSRAASRAAASVRSSVAPSSLSSSSSSFSSSHSLSVDALQVRSSLPPIIDDRKPDGLAGSGPEMFVLLLLPLLALYSGTLHLRAQRRHDLQIA